MKKLFLMCLLAFCTLVIAEEPTMRIVSVGGGATETIAALGGERYLVGIDTSSTWPLTVKTLPQVGYQRTLTPEGILSLNPTIVVVTADAGPAGTLKHITDAGIKLLTLPSAPELITVRARIKQVATLLGENEKGDALWNAVQENIKEARKIQNSAHKKVLFVLAVPGRPPMIAGTDTEADTMITLAGGKNAANTFAGYRTMTPESLHESNPDVILITDEGLQAMGGEEQLWQIPGIQQTNAAKEKAYIAMDTGFLLNFGPRTGEAVLALTQQLGQPK